MDSQQSPTPSRRARVLVLLAGLAILAALVAWFATYQQPPASTNLPSTNTSTNASTNVALGNTNAASFPKAGWDVYRDPIYGFAFQHPSDWIVKQLAEVPLASNKLDPASAWPGAITIRLPDSDEAVPMFKALAGTEQDAIAWLNEHIEPYAATDKTVTIGGRAGRVMQPTRGGGNTFAIVQGSRFTLVALLDPTDASYSSRGTATAYQQILDTFQFSTS